MFVPSKWTSNATGSMPPPWTWTVTLGLQFAPVLIQKCTMNSVNHKIEAEPIIAMKQKWLPTSTNNGIVLSHMLFGINHLAESQLLQVIPHLIVSDFMKLIRSCIAVML